MTLTLEQLEKRKNYIGASEVSVIFGLNPWMSPYDLYLLKTGKVEREERDNKAMDAGNRLEPAVLNFAEEKLGPLERGPGDHGVEYQAMDGVTPLPIHSTCDAILKSTGEPVEAKTSSIADYWGDEGSDQVPEYYIIQCQTQLLCLNNPNILRVYVPALISKFGFEFKMYEVARNDEIIAVIKERCLDFWERHVVGDTPPDGIPSIDLVRKVRREPDAIAEVAPDLFKAWVFAEAEKKEAEKRLNEAKAAVLAAMGTAEATVLTDQGGATYYEQTARRFDSKRFKDENPGMHKEFIKMTTSRVLRYKKPKK